ncbi:hypothetical protein FRC07_014644, partial [Ceratobasidium sp. 392]
MCVGELRNAIMRIENPLVGGGAGMVKDVWIVMGEAGWPVLPQCLDHQDDISSLANVFNTRNTLDAPEPVSLPLGRLTGSAVLAPGKHLDLQLAYCGHEPGLHDISALLVFRKEEDATFYTAHMRIPFHVEPLLQVATRVQPSAASPICSYSLVAEIENAGALQVQISQLSTAGIAWRIQENVPTDDDPLLSISPTQLGRAFATLESRGPDSISQAIETRAFTTRQLRSVLDGAPPGLDTTPPAVDVFWSRTNSDPKVDAAIARHFLFASRRAHVLRQLKIQVPLIPMARAASLVPLFGANDLDVILEYTSANTRG